MRVRTSTSSCRERWQESILKTYGDHLRTAPISAPTPYPRSSPLISASANALAADRSVRPDPISDFMRKQHLDPLDVEFGIPAGCSISSSSRSRNLEFGAAIQRAINEVAACLLVRPARPRAESLDPGRAGRYRSRHRRGSRQLRPKTGRYMCRSMSVPRANEPLGRRRYWPIYAPRAGIGSAARHSRRRLSMAGHAPTGRAAGRPIMSRSINRTRIRWRPQLGKPRHRRRARTFSAAQDRLHRGAAFGWIPRDHLADGPAFRTLSAARLPHLKRRPVRICEAAFLVHDPSRSTSRMRPSTCGPLIDWGRRRPSGCSRRIIRTGISTIRGFAFRPAAEATVGAG